MTIIKIRAGEKVPSGARFIHKAIEPDTSQISTSYTETPCWFGFGVRERTRYYHPNVTVFYYEVPTP